jgi:integrase
MANAQAALKLVSDPTPAGSRYWRAYFPDPITGKRRKISTGISDDGTKASWAEAQAVALKIIEAARVVPPTPAPAAQTFAQFSAGFWDWDTSEYVRARLARDAKAFQQESVRNNKISLENHVVPLIGHLALTDITPDVLDELVTTLLGKINERTKQPLAPQTVKHAVNTISPIFDAARRKHLIPYNPIPSMLPFTARSRVRDAFTVDEARKLLNPSRVVELWGVKESKTRWGKLAQQRPRHNPWVAYSISVLLFATGARASSVITLASDDIVEAWSLRPDGSRLRYYQVRLDQSIGAIQGIKDGTKTGTGTVVPVAAAIMDTILQKLPKAGWLFPGRGKLKLYSIQSARLALHEALDRIGVKDPERRERLLGLHSWKHTFETRAEAAGLSQEVRSSFTEHQDPKTAKRYSHLPPEDLLGALPVQLAILRA